MSTINELSGVLDSFPMDESSALYESVRSHYLFAGLGADDFERLAAQVVVTSLEKGEFLFHRGDDAEYFYFIDSGLVELSLISPTGDKKTLEVIGAGRTFGEAVAFMQGRKYPVSAEALQDSELCRIPNRTYVELIRSNSDASMRLLADVSRHLHDRVREIEHLTIQNARTRLTSYLVDHLVEPPVDDGWFGHELRGSHRRRGRGRERGCFLCPEDSDLKDDGDERACQNAHGVA